MAKSEPNRVNVLCKGSSVDMCCVCYPYCFLCCGSLLCWTWRWLLLLFKHLLHTVHRQLVHAFHAYRQQYTLVVILGSATWIIFIHKSCVLVTGYCVKLCQCLTNCNHSLPPSVFWLRWQLLWQLNLLWCYCCLHHQGLQRHGEKERNFQYPKDKDEYRISTVLQCICGCFESNFRSLGKLDYVHHHILLNLHAMMNKIHQRLRTDWLSHVNKIVHCHRNCTHAYGWSP